MDRERIYWFATANQPAGETAGEEARLGRLQSLFGDWHKPIPTLLAATPAEDILQNDIHDLPPCRPDCQSGNWINWCRGLP